MANTTLPNEQVVTLRTAPPPKVDFDDILLGATGAAILALWFVALAKLAFVASFGGSYVAQQLPL